MSEFVSVDRINALKTGIESKTGETYTDLTAGVQALMDGYGQGGGGSIPERTAWYRQAGMPDITVLPISDTSLQIYYTVDKMLSFDRDTISITVQGYESYVEIGEVIDGSFVAKKRYSNNNVFSVTHEVELNVVDSEFPVIFIAVNMSLTTVISTNESVIIIPTDAPIVEVYANTYSNKRYADMTNIRVCTLGSQYANFSINGISPTPLPRNAVYLDFSKHTSATAGTRMLYMRFSNYTALVELKFPTVPKNSIYLGSDGQNDILSVSAFSDCVSIREVDMSIFDTSAITTLNNMWKRCVNLKKLDLSGCDFRSCTNTTYMFDDCFALETVVTDGTTLPPVSFSMEDCKQLTVDSLVGIIAALPTLAEDATATLTLGATNTAKLTEGQIAVATAKGWTIA